MKQKNLIIFFTGILIFLSPVISSQTVNQVPANDKLVVLWTSDDPMVAERKFEYKNI